MFHKNKKNKRKKIGVIVSSVALAIILLTFSLQITRKITVVEDLFKTADITIQKIVMYPFTALNGKKNVDQSESYLIQKNVNEALEKEIRELKEYLRSRGAAVRI